MIVDRDGRIFSWGWNHSGKDGMGMHAEEHAISRANRKRLINSTIYTAGERRRSGNIVSSFPCESCLATIVKVGIGRIVYRDKNGEWKG